jgi:hypothetical protein
MTRTEKFLAWGGGVVVAILVGVGIYEETKSKPSAAPSGVQNVVLTQDHYYTIAFTCPSAGAQPKIAALAGVTLISSTPSANGGTIVIQYTGASGTYPVTTSGCSIVVTDNGTSAPVSGTQQQGGVNQATLVNQGHLPAAQNLDLTSNGTGVANAVNGSALQVTAPWAISSVAPSPAYEGAAAITGNVAKMVLTGTSGLFDITGPPPASPIVTVRVT